ncbi:prepilin-type N-terminal cleavage/methylation domain-containing protein [Patescibacteria group bacterium]|nr:prepilin-type N-terminal cleavage/methylation domain-containing protein [Patescibacteria group bacterium]
MARGFTLPELLVVAFIMVMLTTLAVANYRTGEEQYLIRAEARRLAMEIQRVREMGISAREVESPTSGYPFVPQGGYGMHIEAGPPLVIFTFLDCNNNARFNPMGKPCIVGIDSFGEGDISKTVELDERVQVEDIQPGGFPLDIVFEPPDPTVSIRTGGGFQSEVNIILSLKADPSRKATITINSSGLVYVE